MAYTTIDDPSAHFQTQLYTGNAGVNNITNGGNSNLQPDWVWLKSRDLSQPHTLRDSTRGTNKFLYITNTDEGTNTYLTSFNSDGFSMNATDNEVNGNSNTYVAWQWKANGGTRTTFTESSNNPGGGRQVNTTAGFSIIDYVGTGGNGTIAHGLGAVPNLVIAKARDTGTSDSWFTHWTGLLADAARIIYWNNQDGQANNATAFNSTAPTSTNVTVGTNSGTNTDAKNYIMYAITNIQGYSKVGSYEGNGSASSGAFVYTGFKPKWLYVRRFDSGDNSQMVDIERDPVNEMDAFLIADTNGAENTHANNIHVDFLSNGFKMYEDNGIVNADGGDYVYWAYADNPFVSSKGVPTTAR